MITVMVLLTTRAIFGEDYLVVHFSSIDKQPEDTDSSEKQIMHEIENILSANLTVFIKLFEERHIL
jgi:hypothetical protein